MVPLLLRWRGLTSRNRSNDLTGMTRVSVGSSIVDLWWSFATCPTPQTPIGFSPIKVIAALDSRAFRRAVDLPLPACDTGDPLGLSAFGRRLPGPSSSRRPLRTVMSSLMNNAEFQLQALGDPRLAVHATSAPARMAVVDRRHADPVGQSGRRARVRRGQQHRACQKDFRTGRSASAPGRAARRPPAANGAVRLERLQGFGAAPGMLATCGCSRLDFPDGSHGILVAAGNTAGRIMPLVERLQRLVEGLDDAGRGVYARRPDRRRQRCRVPCSAFTISSRPVLRSRSR